MPVEDAPFIVHWLNNKEMSFTNKVDRIYRRPPSAQSMSSGINEEILSTWVCVEEKSSPGPEGVDEYQMFDIGDYVAPQAEPQSPKHTSPQKDTSFVLDKKKEVQLTEEWISSPDLLVCIHPNTGSLMVWTMEGLDTPKHSTKWDSLSILVFFTFYFYVKSKMFEVLILRARCQTELVILRVVFVFCGLSIPQMFLQ